MNPSSHTTVLGILYFLLCIPAAQPGLILHLDAAWPGSNPLAQWDDLSGEDHHVTNHGAGYSPSGQVYLFGGPDPGHYPAAYQVGDADGPRRAYLELADSGAFDFETDRAGVGTPFTIVAWYQIGVDPGDDFASTLVAKGTARSNEWKIRPRSIGGNTELIFNEISDRTYARSTGTPAGFHLLMVTHDGSGSIAGCRIYFNGEEQQMDNAGNDLATTTSNSGPVRIGAGHDTGPSSGFFFEGKIGFIEVWDEVLDGQYAMERYNQGTPTRAGPPPPPPSLLLLLDASAPGPNPSATWNDLSGKNNHFNNAGAAYDAAQSAYCFGGPEPDRTGSAGGTNSGPVDGPFDAHLKLAGTDTDFDFRTDAEAGNGDPFTMVAWLELGVDPGDNYPTVLLQKGSSTSTEWKIRPRSIGGNTELILNEGFQSARLLTRANPTPVDFHLLMITHDGSGRGEGTRFYFNGVEATKETPDNHLSQSILSDAPLHIGAGFDRADGIRFFEGKIGLIEIWEGIQPQQYALDRFIELNGGPEAPATFQDQTADLIPGLSGLTAAWGDFNNDGYADLLDGKTLWKNNAGAGFSAVTDGLEPGIWGDCNNDGWLDLFHWGNWRGIRRNVGGSSFAVIPDPGLPAVEIRGASWGDWDGDGYLDLYVGGYQHYHNYEPDIILENNGGTSFFTRWQESENLAPGRGVTSCDFDRDGDLDIYVSNYRLRANMLWQNNGAGGFQDVAASYGATGGAAHTIGSAWGDLDNDGYFDLFVGNFAHPGQPESKFLKNRGPSGSYHFLDRSSAAGLHFQESYASPTLGDYDNDGDLDLFFTTVYDETQTSGGVINQAVLYRNDGNFNFKNVTAKEGLAGIKTTYQAAWADFDVDGDLDLVTNSRIYVNRGNDNHWLEVQLDGGRRGVNGSAIGAQVMIQIDGQTLTRQVEGATGEGNQNALALHFGLGSRTDPVDLEILWPDGTTEMVGGVAVDKLIHLPFPVRPDFTRISRVTPGVTLQWKSESDRVYRVEKCPGLGQPFVELANRPSTEPLNTYIDTTPESNTSVYRIVLD